MLSNDVKWNKIQEIMKLLDVIYNNHLIKYQLEDHYLFDYHVAAKLAHRDTWILANQIYDVTVDGCYCHIKITPYYDKAHHWQYTINRVLSLGDYGNENLEILYKFRDKYWEEYDYLNS
jgi:hypothetical protein